MDRIEQSKAFSNIDNSGSENDKDSVVIAAIINQVINYASWQNSVPFLTSLNIKNNANKTLEEIHLEMKSEPAFLRPKKWIIDRVSPGKDFVIVDHNIEIDAAYLNQLNEAERGQVKFQLQIGETTIATKTYEIRMLARNEWSGLGGMSELLAAFIMPNDPIIAKILKNAGEALLANGQSPSLEGYQSSDPDRVYLLTSAIWSAIAMERLTYANPPQSFELVGQKTRPPTTVITDGLATCLDTTLLFASAIESVGLNSVTIFLKGHCFVGVWLHNKSFSTLVTSDITEIRKAIKARELLVFETTLITGCPPASFGDAKRKAELVLDPSNEDNFIVAIDIKRARMAQIRPLPSYTSSAVEIIPDTEFKELGLSLPPRAESEPALIDYFEEKPKTPASRVERWQRKLLDLSLRNRLLNFKSSKQTVPLFCPNIPELEDKIASGLKLRIISLTEESSIGARDAKLHYQKTQKEINVEYAIAAFERGELAAMLDPKELSVRLTELYRKAKNDLAEGGSNTLYLAVGFLRWKNKSGDQSYYLAPLLLVPVKLLRNSASSPFQLANHEDEVRFNSTLLQMLIKDFGLDLTDFESNLPSDEKGIDVNLVMEKMRRSVRALSGFEVIEEAALSTFSFAKFLMWKDLVDRLEQLGNNRVVRHLIQNPDKAFEPGVNTAFPRCKDIDRKYLPGDLVCPLPADSSQLAAIAAVAEGHDFVLIGPPGTGKSQTIANIIAQCLAVKKSVLFVAEKTAALDVVYRRLRERGLGNYCLELHSNKAERRKFLDQMNAAWVTRQRSDPNQWHSITERLKIRRNELNGYVEALHAEDANGWSLFRAMGVSVKQADQLCPELQWSESVEHDKYSFNAMVDLINEMSLTFKALGGAIPPRFIKATEWSVAWESNLLKECDNLRQFASDFQSIFQDFVSLLGSSGLADCSPDQLQKFLRVARTIIATDGADFRIVFDKKFAEVCSGVETLANDITSYHAEIRLLAASYDEESLARIPVDDLDRAWREANIKFWPFSYYSKLKVQKLLQSYVQQGVSEPQNDLPKLRTIQRLIGSIAANPLVEKTPHWKGHNSDIEKLREHLSIAKEARQAIVDLGKSLSNFSEISAKLIPILAAESSDSPILCTSRDLLESAKKFSASMHAFKNLAGSSPARKSSDNIFAEIFNATDHLKTNRFSLQKFTSWASVKNRAESFGLNSFVSAVESGQFSTDGLASVFELAYVRWWLPRAIDRQSAVRCFQQYTHENLIQDFQKLDDLAREEASSYIEHILSHDLPSPEQVPKQSELGMLRHQIQLKKPSKSIRSLIESMPRSFSTLAPCLLMSPLSIAQYLPSNQALFDVVIFDEASQITTWDAIGAIARGRQTVIVGDPKQLPPTNFFGRTDEGDDSDDLDPHEHDLESILDEAKASGLPTLQLNWHYRSSHESLITFSNWHYYNNELITFPSASTKDQAVTLKYLSNGVYDRGKSRTNRQEAEAIVADAVERMKQWVQLPEADRLTLGVITFNSQQQSLIQDLFDEAQRLNPEIEWFFKDERIEPTIVKNLENVQGDERDVMMFSIAFGPDPSGKMPLVFGALNRTGGERRLNVAATRARKELVVYASFRAEQLNVEKTKSIGVRHLKNFLDYADRGVIALHAEQSGSMGEVESPLEEAVLQRLTARGWQLVAQIGVSGFRVDLGVVNPDKPGSYLAGIECDGATYHRSATARDRDKQREQILRNLGWEIIRIWSPDWWYDCEGATERVHQLLCALLEDDRGREKTRESISNKTESLEGNDVVLGNFESSLIASNVNMLIQEVPLQIDSKSFFLPEYSNVLREVILAELKAESPIREDVLIQRVARLHQFNRSGARIRDRILALIEDVACSEESTGRFLWSTSSPLHTTNYRNSLNQAESRPIDEIAIAELSGLILSFQTDLSEPDPALAIARRLGIARLSRAGRERIQEAIERTERIIQPSE